MAVIQNSCYLIAKRYSPLRGLTSSSCGGLRPSAEAFFALRAKKELIILFWPIFGIFWSPVITLVTFSSNISNNNNKNNKIKEKSKNFNQSSPVHPVSEFRGGTLSVTNRRTNEQTEILVSNIG